MTTWDLFAGTCDFVGLALGFIGLSVIVSGKNRANVVQKANEVSVDYFQNIPQYSGRWLIQIHGVPQLPTGTSEITRQTVFNTTYKTKHELKTPTPCYFELTSPTGEEANTRVIINYDGATIHGGTTEVIKSSILEYTKTSLQAEGNKEWYILGEAQFDSTTEGNVIVGKHLFPLIISDIPLENERKRLMLEERVINHFTGFICCITAQVLLTLRSIKRNILSRATIRGNYELTATVKSHCCLNIYKFTVKSIDGSPVALESALQTLQNENYFKDTRSYTSIVGKDYVEFTVLKRTTQTRFRSWCHAGANIISSAGILLTLIEVYVSLYSVMLKST